MYFDKYPSHSMHHLTPMLADILAGPRGKGSGGALNSSKVLLILLKRPFGMCVAHINYPHEYTYTFFHLYSNLYYMNLSKVVQWLGYTFFIFLVLVFLTL